MRYTFRKSCLVTLCCLSFIGCLGNTSGQQDAEAVTENFGNAYFNYDFTTALSYCTPESECWLRFAASNISQADVDVLRAMSKGAEVVVDDIYYTNDDTTATVSLRVSGGMVCDTIGRNGHVVGENVYRLSLVRRKGRWLVRMASLPRSEM